ncbi:Tetratricopeptide repeat protein 5 [Desmophyllum pertusum]|uniref:Tetratricopeptide repeat protein 5 n=1 Tax=Desmophyllum pertusum TaxID=174260 RepID=A0A9X0CS57_9CNID|nr:Tetratricopeptide repeat protein 5 [Desmophyllum pertusum]
MYRLLVRRQPDAFFLRGKALNVIWPEYNPLAQDALSKAVKLDPKLVEAWNCLGEFNWN